MYYEVFPFGKYKGVKLTELPSTYIVLALEKFELPTELKEELSKIFLGRFNMYSQAKDLVASLDSESLLELLSSRIKQYEIPF